MSIIKDAIDVAFKGIELAQKQKEMKREEEKMARKEFPCVALTGNIQASSKKLEELCKGIVFDVFNVIDYDDGDNLCVRGGYEYVPITLQIKNIGTGNIKKMIIDDIYICAESMEGYERKCKRGVEADKLICGTECEYVKEIELNEGEEKKVTFLFSEEENWVNKQKICNAVKNGPIYIEMDIRLLLTDNSWHTQKMMWSEFNAGKLIKSGCGEGKPYKNE